MHIRDNRLITYSNLAHDLDKTKIGVIEEQSDLRMFPTYGRAPYTSIVMMLPIVYLQMIIEILLV